MNKIIMEKAKRNLQFEPVKYCPQGGAITHCSECSVTFTKSREYERHKTSKCPEGQRLITVEETATKKVCVKTYEAYRQSKQKDKPQPTYLQYVDSIRNKKNVTKVWCSCGVETNSCNFDTHTKSQHCTKYHQGKQTFAKGTVKVKIAGKTQKVMPYDEEFKKWSKSHRSHRVFQDKLINKTENGQLMAKAKPMVGVKRKRNHSPQNSKPANNSKIALQASKKRERKQVQVKSQEVVPQIKSQNQMILRKPLQEVKQSFGFNIGKYITENKDKLTKMHKDLLKKVKEKPASDFVTHDIDMQQYKLDKKQLMKCKGNNWFSNLQVDAFIMLLNNLTKKRDLLHPWFAFDPEKINQIRRNKDHKTSAKQQQSYIERIFANHTGKTIQDIGGFFFPILKDDHWTILCLDKQQRTWHHIDSMLQTEDRLKRSLKNSESAQSYIGKHLASQKVIDKKLQYGKNKINFNVPQHPDYKQCGLAACLNMLQLSFKDPKTKVNAVKFSYKLNKKTIPLLRKKVFIELHNGELLVDPE